MTLVGSDKLKKYLLQQFNFQTEALFINIYFKGKIIMIGFILS